MTRLANVTRRRLSLSAALGLTIALAAALIPLGYLVSLSFMSQGQISAGSVIPTEPTLTTWEQALTSGVVRGVANSLIAALMGALITLIFALPTTWAMVRSRTGGRALAGSILSPWLLPPIVAVVPIFSLLRVLQLNNSLAGLILIYALANTAVAIWLLEGFLRRIPRELDEAAQLDGAGPLRVLAKIVTPLSAPGLVAVGVIVAVLNYHEFVLATFITQGPESQTLPVVLSNLLSERAQNYGKIAAASIIGIIPVFAGATFLQRWLVGGLIGGK